MVKKSAKKLSKPIRCIETGEIFPSASEVERKLGISNANINKNCRGKYKSAGGLHWEFIENKENEN